MRGALGFAARVSVICKGADVRVAPNKGVADGPPIRVGGGSVALGTAVMGATRVGATVAVAVAVGCAVGTMGSDAAPQLDITSDTAMTKAKPQSLEGTNNVLIGIL